MYSTVWRPQRHGWSTCFSGLRGDRDAPVFEGVGDLGGTVACGDPVVDLADDVGGRVLGGAAVAVKDVWHIADELRLSPHHDVVVVDAAIPVNDRAVRLARVRDVFVPALGVLGDPPGVLAVHDVVDRQEQVIVTVGRVEQLAVHAPQHPVV